MHLNQSCSIPPSRTLREAQQLSVSQSNPVLTREGADGPTSPLPPFPGQSPQGAASSELRQLRGHANNKIVLVRVLNSDKDKVGNRIITT